MTHPVFVTRPIPEAGLELLRAVRGRQAVLCLLTDRIDAEVLDAAKGCRIFANMAVGYDNIDVPAASDRGVAVSNTPGVLTDATADFAWALLFATSRRIVEADAFMRSGKYEAWGPLMFLGADITGRTLGVVGAGRIGAAVALKSKGFNMRVLYADERNHQELESQVGARRVSFDELLAESDFVSVHTPLTPETRHLFDASAFARMKKSAILVNTSRGPVIDEAALVEALRTRTIAGAGLDVYEREPEAQPGLAALPNVVVVPHIASATHETRGRMASMAAENIVAILKGRKPPQLVNPEVWKV